MGNFERTEAVLTEIASDQNYMFGVHDSSQPKVGAYGRVIGEEPYDAIRHEGLVPNVLSVWEDIMGEPQICVAVPERPLKMNVVIHNDPESQTDPRIVKMKQNLAHLLKGSIEESLPGMTDYAFSYSVNEGQDEADPDVEVIQPRDDSELEGAKTVAELCIASVNFVISDFRRLPLHLTDSTDLSLQKNTIAIKVNHPAEMSAPFIPKGPVVALGNKAELNTGNKAEVDKYNARCKADHDAIVMPLERAGIPVAHIVFDRRNHPQFDFDITRADGEIAAALRRLPTE